MPTYELLSWGANSHGQLGLGIKTELSSSPQKVDLSTINFKPENIKKISGGAGHTILLDQNGKLYSCGWNHRGQLGIPRESNDVSTFHKIDDLNKENIIDVACGWDASMALSSNGEVFAFGSNAYGQLGLSNRESTHFEKPFKISPGEKVRKIAMGLRHSALVTEKNDLLMSGAGNKGQLGIVDSNSEPIKQIHRFTKVPNLPKIIDVSCGQYHTIAVGEHGDIFVCGSNKYGQLGIDAGTYPQIFSTVKMRHFESKIAPKVFCGWTHSTVFLEDEGKIFTWGRNSYGQLGRENPLSQNPDFMENLTKSRKVSTGSEHHVLISEDKTIWTWGWNEHGNCGNGKTENIFLPGPLNFPSNYEAVAIGCGAGHSYAVVKILD